MAEYTATAQAGGDDEDYASRTPAQKAEYWTKEINAAKKWMQRWHAEARKIESYYLVQDEGNSTLGDTHYCLFWSNVQTILAIMYGRVPKVAVERTNLDPNDDVARVAAIILERIFNIELSSIDKSPYFTYLEGIRDLFIAGMGISWARYSYDAQQVQSEAVMDPMTGVELAPAAQMEIVTDEFAPIDYVRWSDFLCSPVRRWDDVRWLARRVPMGKVAYAKRFPTIPFGSLPTTPKQANRYGGPDDPSRYMGPNTVDVWEIWDKESKEVCWFVEGYSETLESAPDPLGLVEFFPVKAPLRSTSLTNSLIPRPDYVYLRDQYAELDLIATRLRVLTKSLRVVGVYDKANDPVKRVLNEAVPGNEMIPVDNWAMFAEKGGMKGVVDWFPLDMVVGTLEKLTARKNEIIQDIYEIYGINDVMRGATKASETATAQRLKSQFGTARIDVRQQQVAWWVTMNTRMRAEIICKHWSPETIVKRSNILATADAPYAQQAIQLLKSGPENVITRLTISADTIASPDWQLEKQQRTELLQGIAQFVGMTMPFIQQFPGSISYMVQVLQWAVAGFKGSKQIEGVLDQALAAVQKDIATPKPPKPPTPREIKDMSSAAKAEADARESAVKAMSEMAMMGVPPQMYGQIPIQPVVMPPQKMPQQPGGPGPQGPQGQQPMPQGSAMMGPRNVPGPGGAPAQVPGPNMIPPPQ